MPARSGSWLAGTLQQNEDIIIVTSCTCAILTITSKNVCVIKRSTAYILYIDGLQSNLLWKK